MKSCNREDLLIKTSEELSRNYRLCERHFEEKYISRGGGIRKHLFERSKPTIFPHIEKRTIDEINTYEEPMKKTVISGELFVVLIS